MRLAPFRDILQAEDVGLIHAPSATRRDARGDTMDIYDHIDEEESEEVVSGVRAATGGLTLNRLRPMIGVG
ncbi:MAG: hypothetical protein FP824_05205 [Euryarchaeota archaeon]|nr:hypothetical protein [Euryarchaeota archaeon]